MKVAILKANETQFEGFASEVVLPASGGQLSVLDDHEFFFAALGKGHIYLRLKSQTASARPLFLRRAAFGRSAVETFSIHGGVARMKNNELVILAE